MNNPIEEDVLLKVQGLEKSFEQGGQKLTIFQNLDMKIEAGELVSLVGQSGAGKSTLLHICGLLDKPTVGRVSIDGRRVEQLGDKERTALRLKTIGFVYQFHRKLHEGLFRPIF